ncbi:hypothetical protein NQ318_021028 [Aromia moschata]|uniref:Uncharacterized protein n=1 Tax=Aromia moschata TaxID=1265417 RepID=A0AAV8YLQ0_9CUCU|nr:hypothetical protein NQ318_021028 [Aromia moschata]
MAITPRAIIRTGSNPACVSIKIRRLKLLEKIIIRQCVAGNASMLAKSWQRLPFSQPAVGQPDPFAKLEEMFAQQLEEQERVYGPITPLALPSDLTDLNTDSCSRIGIGSTRSSLSSVSEG